MGQRLAWGQGTVGPAGPQTGGTGARGQQGIAQATLPSWGVTHVFRGSAAGACAGQHPDPGREDGSPVSSEPSGTETRDPDGGSASRSQGPEHAANMYDPRVGRGAK